MGLILIGIFFGSIGYRIFKRVINNESEKLFVGKCFISAIACVLTIMLIANGLCAFRISEGEYRLESTHYVSMQEQNDSKYEVFDEENNILYCFEGSEVEVLKDGKRGMYGNKIMYDCTIIEGDYTQPYIEVYEVDYKMNFWSFELVNTLEYILYVPEKIVNN